MTFPRLNALSPLTSHPLDQTPHALNPSRPLPRRIGNLRRHERQRVARIRFLTPTHIPNNTTSSTLMKAYPKYRDTFSLCCKLAPCIAFSFILIARSDDAL